MCTRAKVGDCSRFAIEFTDDALKTFNVPAPLFRAALQDRVNSLEKVFVRLGCSHGIYGGKIHTRRSTNNNKIRKRDTNRRNRRCGIRAVRRDK